MLADNGLLTAALFPLPTVLIALPVLFRPPLFDAYRRGPDQLLSRHQAPSRCPERKRAN
jgi:hypothetical protein